MIIIVLKAARTVMMFCFLVFFWRSNHAFAQLSYSTKAISEQEWFEKLPAPIRLPAQEGEALANDARYKESIRALESVLAMPETRHTKNLFRAWLHQWLAYNFAALDSTEMARKHVQLSLQEEIDIWPDNLDQRMPNRVRFLYQQCYVEILDRFLLKRRSWRLAVGTITRADLSYRYGFFDFAFGVGTTLPIEWIRKLLENKAAVSEELLLYVRIQRMRKNIKRLSAGFFLEFALLENFEDEKIKPARTLSAGPILSFAYQSGWEVGSSFEVARFVFDEGSGSPHFSQTIEINKNWALSYGNFEIYLRKWF